MKKTLITASLLTFTICLAFYLVPIKSTKSLLEKPMALPPEGCVFNTVMGIEPIDPEFEYTTPDNVISSVTEGMKWMENAQQVDGGWGAGSHSMQHIRDPKAVKTDPATTAMVCMALLRNGNTLYDGEFSMQLRDGTEYLVEAAENSDPASPTITTVTGTQIQSKLGANIDVVLTMQYFSNLLEQLQKSDAYYDRVMHCLNICVEKVQSNQAADGSLQGNGWAGVLQSSFATSALEAADVRGADVDEKSLDDFRKDQKDNTNAESGDVRTDRGAGVVLYAVSGSARASAKEARKAKEDIAQAITDGRLGSNEEVTIENLEEIGYSEDEALKMGTAYKVYETAKERSQDKAVLKGYGNDGGEEFMSILQTGESMIVNQDMDWKGWYDSTSDRLVQIQNEDGSWNGHHCITSPVFCTATCLLVLTVNNDIERLVELGANN